MDQPERFRITSDHDTMVVSFLESHLSREDHLQDMFKVLKQRLDEMDLVQVVLDFRAVTFVSSSLLGQLVGLKKFLDERGGTFRIAHINDDIKDTMRITRLDEWIEIDPTIEESIAKLHEIRANSTRTGKTTKYPTR